MTVQGQCKNKLNKANLNLSAININVEAASIHLNSLSSPGLPTKGIRHYPSSNNIQGIVAALAPYSAIPAPSPHSPAELIPGHPPGHRRSKGGAAKLSLRPGRS
ncbi:hypothetical protein CDAR_310241 [Caerostris darwini]|uniref:Uncharacterized protein n=1 Tax=Caerostris darwini TaxID=1538125 RepID=A0AAV4WQT3_9ARAC|nr:hypothetical protein CDAR_310241 [Caerostris darwini]